MKWFNVREVFFLILCVFVITGCGKGSGSSSGHWKEGDTDRPFVVSVTPLDGAVEVALDTTVSARFNEAMRHSTIDGSTFTLMHGFTTVSGDVTYSGVTAVFTPTSPLIANTVYTATVTTGAKDVNNNALASDYVWSFTTASGPVVVLTVPINNAVDVPLNTEVTATFNEAMKSSSITGLTFTLFNGPTQVTGAVSYSGLTATFLPDNPLIANTVYTGTITTGAQDLASIHLTSNYSWNFTTGFTNDTDAPFVNSTDPGNGGIEVAITNSVFAIFNEPMAPSSINTTTFTLFVDSGPQVTGTVTYAGLTGVFKPNSPLIANTLYDAEITTGATDLAGNPLASNYDWSFTTGSALIVGPIFLGSAASYGIMATAAITSAGTNGTDINGDVSLDPGTSMTGFPPGIVNGAIHINDTESALARADLLVAYNTAKGLPPGHTISAGADLGALYPLGIPPGTYTSGSTMLVSTPLTLTAGATIMPSGSSRSAPR